MQKLFFLDARYLSKEGKELVELRTEFLLDATTEKSALKEAKRLVVNLLEIGCVTLELHLVSKEIEVSEN